MAQTNIGRNDPCHCGSGKKYKKCCLAKVEEAKQAANVELGVTAADSDSSREDKKRRKERDSHIEAFNAQLKDFEAADYEAKFSIFHRTLDDPVLMDGEMAFEMLQDLFRYTIEHGERNRFDALVANLRERRPETYAAEASFFLKWRIEMMNQLYHRASALFGIVPAWLRFLETRGLIDAEVRAQTLGNLTHLADSLGRIFGKYIDDPGPCQALNGWRS